VHLIEQVEAVRHPQHLPTLRGVAGEQQVERGAGLPAAGREAQERAPAPGVEPTREPDDRLLLKGCQAPLGDVSECVTDRRDVLDGGERGVRLLRLPCFLHLLGEALEVLEEHLQRVADVVEE
jgi:hypothetical protein